MENIILPSLFDQVGEEEAVQPVKVEEASVEKKARKNALCHLPPWKKSFQRLWLHLVRIISMSLRNGLIILLSGLRHLAI